MKHRIDPVVITFQKPVDKPVILIGNGLRNNPEMVEHLCSLGVPVLVTWQAIDLVSEDTPVFCGRPGIFGQRAANIIQQMASKIYIFGARLDGEQTAHDYSRFAPNAEKHIYDVDMAELQKLPREWVKEYTDLSKINISFINFLPRPVKWLEYARGLYNRFRAEFDNPIPFSRYADPFTFMNALSDAAQPGDLLAVGSSSWFVNSFLQSFKVKRGQRVTVCASIGAMGADIPMALGGAIASGRRTICVTGDGGFQLNTQELETIHRLDLPITFFVADNGGYQSIRHMQKARFDGHVVGADRDSGFTIPSLHRLAEAYGISWIRLNDYKLRTYISNNGPRIVSVPVDPDWIQLPRVIATRVNGELRTDDMQDMTPKLDPAELARIMEWTDD